MRSKILTAVSVFLLGIMIASVAVAQDFQFQLNGVEISHGTTSR